MGGLLFQQLARALIALGKLPRERPGRAAGGIGYLPPAAGHVAGFLALAAVGHSQQPGIRLAGSATADLDGVNLHDHIFMALGIALLAAD